MPARSEIVQEARSYLGVRWRHQGRSRNGIDCVGLIVNVAKSLSISDYDFGCYGRRSSGSEFISHFENNMDQKTSISMLDGDVLVFRDGSFPCHCGISATDEFNRKTLIHAHSLSRKVVEDLYTEDYWGGKLVACFSFRGIDNG